MFIETPSATLRDNFVGPPFPALIQLILRVGNDDIFLTRYLNHRLRAIRWTTKLLGEFNNFQHKAKLETQPLIIKIISTQKT